MNIRLTLTLLFALVLLAPGTSHAATYTQYACKLPDGTPIAADGFSGYGVGGSTLYTNTCATGGALAASVPGTSSDAPYAVVSYSPPPFTTIATARISRRTTGFAAPGNALYELLDTSDKCDPLTSCGSGLALSTFAANSAFASLDFRVSCHDVACSNAVGATPTIHIERAEIDLSDVSNPTFSRPPAGGMFDTSRTLHGAEAVTFTADDTGGGVSSASLIVDGVEVDRRVLDANGGKCATPYVVRIPCKGSVAADYAFDTSALTDGQHAVALVVRDATETNQVVHGPVAVVVDNTPAPVAQPTPDPGPSTPSTPIVVGDLPPVPGTLTPVTKATTPAKKTTTSPKTTTTTMAAAVKPAFAKGEKERTVGNGSATTIRGRLVDAKGHAIARARLDVRARVRMAGAKTRTIAHVTTSSTGAYSYRLPAGASRDVTFGYKRRASDRAYAATRRIVVYVKAAVSLTRSAATLRNGEALTLTAHVLGPNVTRRATTVAFQVLIGSSWRTFASASIDAHGVARVRHRFRYTTTATTYRFRARTSRTSAFPYLTGTSAVRDVRVGPAAPGPGTD